MASRIVFPWFLLPLLFLFFLFFLFFSCLLFACGASKDVRTSPRGDAGTTALDLSVDFLAPVSGAPSRGRDPAIFAIDVAGERLCTAVLLASNLVLTARPCVEARDPPSLVIRGGDDFTDSPPRAPLLALGREVVVPQEPSAGDPAFVILDRDLDDVTPLPIRDDPVQRSERIRTVSFDKRGEDPVTKLVREHVAVTDVAAAQFQVAEATCQGDAGGTALDESTGEVLGMVTQGSISCGDTNAPAIYTRIDLHRPLTEEAMARAKQRRVEDLDAADAGRPRAKTPKKSKPPTDVGQSCQSGTECATGICVHEESQAYCSRSCGSGDRCLAGYRCKEATNTKVCGRGKG